MCAASSVHDLAVTALFTLSLHDALPILALGLFASLIIGLITETIGEQIVIKFSPTIADALIEMGGFAMDDKIMRSEEHTSELQSRGHLVCRLLLEKKKKQATPMRNATW